MDRTSTENLEKAVPFFSNTKDLKYIFKQIDSGAEHTIVVVPSLSLKEESVKNIVGIIHYESRALWEVLKASSKNATIVFVSSIAISDDALDHFLNLLPNPCEARKRIKLISLNNSDKNLSLSEKLINDQETLLVIKNLIKNTDAYLKVFMTTKAEHEVAQELNLPVFGHDSSLDYYITKSGNKKIFKESYVPYCDSIEDLKSVEDLILAIHELWNKNPSTKRFMIKLDNGVSGIGNAIMKPTLSKEEFDQLGNDKQLRMVENWLYAMKFQSDQITWGSYSKDIPVGCIVEVFAEGKTKIAPSAQAQILPDGSVEIFATHEQILDESGLTFLGSVFPARNNHRKILQESTIKIGESLASHGFIGPFSVDFLITSDETTTRIFVIEINIRQGGTTHPYQTARLLTESTYCSDKGILVDRDGSNVYYRSNDNVLEEALKGSKVESFLDYMSSNDVTYNKHNGEGVVFHLLGAMPSSGKLGYTSIAKNPVKAQHNSDKVLELINQFIITNQKELPAFHKNLA
jgi:hypothetical protein